MTRHVLACAACTLVLAVPASSAATARSWAQPQIVVVTAYGLMGGEASASAFRPDDPLTWAELSDLVVGLAGSSTTVAVDPATPATIAQLDAQLVRALGLLPVAREFSAGVRAAGLTPPRYFGTEVVARLIGLRVNHPAAQDRLELRPADPATRAEAAYSAARIVRFNGSEVDFVTRLADTFLLDPVSGLQHDVLQTAISLTGYPYVWAGTSEETQDPLDNGKEVPGGFDCSGFVWRVYKLQAYPGAESLPDTIQGRTTYAMSGEVPPAKRISFAKLKPGDLLFFGAHGPQSKPAEIDHAGIYLGGGWFIHSSEQGVALAAITADWYGPRFAWARRPLAEY